MALMMLMPEYVQCPQGSVRAYANRMKANWRDAGWNLPKHEEFLYDIAWARLQDSVQN